MKEIKKGRYLHYKGNEYMVTATAIHSESLEEMVLYYPIKQKNDAYKGKMWVRPLTLFTNEVEVNGIKIKRFKFISDH